MTDASEVSRYAVRRRIEGWVIWDADQRVVHSIHPSKVAADRMCHQMLANVEISEQTYGVTWYCEVDATSPEDATKKARKYLAAPYRENWEPWEVNAINEAH